MKMSCVKTILEKFGRCHKGNIGLSFALAVIPVFMVAGIALDYSRAASLKTHLQASLDAGALAAAAAGSLSDNERIQIAKDVFASNFATQAGTGIEANPQVSIENGETVVMNVAVQQPTVLMQIAGFDTIDISSSVTVNIPKPKKAEIALVLDYSGSMSWTSGGQVKYVAMKNAAIGMVQDLTSTAQAADRIKFGLVPFSHHVYVSLDGAYVLGGTPGVTWTGCTQDRKFPYNTTDASPISGNDDSKWGHPQAPEHISAGCGAYVPNNLIVRPVSGDHDGVVAQLQAMQPYAWTHIALGFEFGWHLVSDSAPFTDVAPNNDEETEKYIVLLTDGQQTEPAFGAGGSRTVSNGEQNLETLCANAKNEGITIVTVAFDLNDPATENRLRNCSTDPAKHFFIAEDSADLASVFEQIKKELAEAIYIAK